VGKLPFGCQTRICALASSSFPTFGRGWSDRKLRAHQGTQETKWEEKAMISSLGGSLAGLAGGFSRASRGGQEMKKLKSFVERRGEDESRGSRA